MLERIEAVHAKIDALKAAMLAPLAQMEASGELLEEGGQKGVKNYLTHAWGIHSGEAERLALLATGLHQESLPDTAQALADGALTLGEATAIASGAEREVKKRDTTARPDAERYRSMIETGLVGAKREREAMSVQSLTRTANALGLELNPDRPEKNEEAAFAERGARLRRTFDGTFHFEAWGPDGDAERLQAALESYTAPYDGDAPISRYARTYDALMAAMTMAHGHHGCEAAPGVKAVINITVPLSTFMDLNNQNPAQDQDESPNQDGDRVWEQGPGEGDGPARTEDGNVVAASVVRAMAPEAQLRRDADGHTGLPWTWARPGTAPGTCAPWRSPSTPPAPGRAGATCRSRGARPTTSPSSPTAGSPPPRHSRADLHNRLKCHRNTATRTGKKTGTGVGARPPGPAGAAGQPTG